MEFEEFTAVLTKIMQETELVMEKEHECIHEFFDQDFPMFKLIYSPAVENEAGEKQDPIVVVSFHLDLDSPSAINWFLKLRQYIEKLHITASYLKDEEGLTYLGQDAVILRQRKIERDALNAVRREVAKKKNEKLTQTSQTLPQNTMMPVDDVEAAVTAFENWNPKNRRPN